MFFWVKYYTTWALASVFGYVIPWWMWGLAGIAGAIALFILLPVVVPERLRLAAAGCVLLLGAIISAGSWGTHHGIYLERAKWEVKSERERTRLQQEAAVALSTEQGRAIEAEVHVSQLQGQLNDLLNAPEPVAAPGDCTPPVIPESFARSVYGWRGHKR